jgi:hypothetical protein
MARALGTEPVELGPGLPGQRRLILLSSLLVMRLGRTLTPTEEAALSLAITEASGRQGSRLEGGGAGHVRGGAHTASPTIPQVWVLLRDPLPEMQPSCASAGSAGCGK